MSAGGAGPDRPSSGDPGRAPGSPGPAGQLFVVATPIGNLGDVTIRALDVLRSVAVIAAEDTRLSRRLLDRYAITARMVSYHARNSATRTPELMARLAAGDDVALVTDAGTPGVSDPGSDLVRAWGELGGRVVPIPGASSVLAAVSATAIAGPRWSFEGFLPRSGRDRRERLAGIGADERGSVVFEAANRLAATLGDLAGACGGERAAAVCRELTKLHEEIVRGTLAELASAVRDGTIATRGEVVIVIGERRGATADGPRGSGSAEPAGAGVAREGDALPAARAEVERLVLSGTGRSEAARRVSAQTGIPRRKLYGGGPEQGDGSGAPEGSAGG